MIKINNSNKYHNLYIDISFNKNNIEHLLQFVYVFVKYAIILLIVSNM